MEMSCKHGWTRRVRSQLAVVQEKIETIYKKI